jgi:septation ring formation regulator EzrA
MDEETTLKFFSRFNKHREQMREIDDAGDELLLKIESKIKEGKRDELNSLIDDYLKNEEEIPKRKSEFVKSLSDILTQEQISKFLVFELRFREEIRDIILKERRRGQE